MPYYPETLSISECLETDAFVSRVRTEKVIPYWKSKYLHLKKHEMVKAPWHNFVITAIWVITMILYSGTLYYISQQYDVLPATMVRIIDNLLGVMV